MASSGSESDSDWTAEDTDCVNTSDGSESEVDTKMDTDNESGSDVAYQPSTNTARRLAEPPVGLVWKNRENFPRKWGFSGTLE